MAEQAIRAGLLLELIPNIKVLAVVVTMQTASELFDLFPTEKSVEAAMQKLVSLIADVVLDDGTLVLILDRMASVRVGPFYALFAGTWEAARVRKKMKRILQQSSVLKSVPFDLQFTSR